MAKNIFNSVLLPAVKSNNFDLSHDIKFSCQMGRIYPTMVLDTIPGDKFRFNSQNMLRFMPLVAPVMHKVDVNSYSFFVPNRILWPEWEEWITRRSDVEAPYIEVSTITEGSLMDYLGYPVGTYSTPLRVSAIPLAAYLKTWNEYFRDQNLQVEYPWQLVPGSNNVGLFTSPGQDWNTVSPPRASWKADYFTKALPFAQQGDIVQLPITASENVPVGFDANGEPGLFRDATTGGLAGIGNVENAAGPVPYAESLQIGGNPAAYDPNGTLNVDIQSDAVDINTFRWAIKLQEWLERNARGGARYVESILSHFGVRSSDARLQRPEFIGMTSQNMVISEVLATAQNPEAGGAALGQMGGHGISVGGGSMMSHFCEEHGYVISMIVIRPKTAYQQGLHRSLSRFSALDYPWPTFAHLGEQEVKQKEIFAASLTPDDTFGYVPRYAEAKFANSRVAGELQTTLDFWHLGRIFATDPALNATFIECAPRLDIFAVTDPEEDHIVGHIFHNVNVRRKLPRYGIPSI